MKNCQIDTSTPIVFATVITEKKTSKRARAFFTVKD